MTNSYKSRMRLHPVNPAEAVIAAFFDPGLSPEAEWVMTPAPGTRNLRRSHSYTVAFAWDASGGSGRVATWAWQGVLDVGDYNGFFLQGAFPTHVTAVLHACLNGEWREVARGQGRNHNADYPGAFTGRRLTGLRLELRSASSGAGAFSSYYLGVYHQTRLDDWLRFEQAAVYPPDWPEFIKPEAEWGELAPGFGLHFDGADLEALRAKIARAPYRELADVLRARAYATLDQTPERNIRQYLPTGVSPYAYSARDRDRGEPPGPSMELCAFFGIIDNDPKLVRMALRCAIAMVHARHWAEGFVEHDFPGSAMNWRSFYQAWAAGPFANTFDWLRGALTPHAVETFCHSLYFKALAPITYDFCRYDYIYHCNQAVIFSVGRMPALLALNAHWPRVGWQIEQAKRDLDETVARILQPDGSHGEGPFYYNAIMGYIVGSYLLLARHMKVPVASLLPPGIAHSADYFGLYAATSGAGAILPVSDGHSSQLNTDWLALLARVTEEPRWNGLLADCLSADPAARVDHFSNQVIPLTTLHTLIYGPDDLSRRASMVPGFRIHPGAGQATSLRETSHGPVRLHLCGASPAEAHSHGDKGAILLEAFGEMLLCDRGMTVYGDPMGELLTRSCMHNLVTPKAADGTNMDQINPCPVAACPKGKGDATSVHLTIDASAAWDPAIVTSTVREVISKEPLLFTLVDEIELSESRPVVFHLHSHHPVSISGNQATFNAQKSCLKVTWEWAGDVVIAAIDLHDGAYQPVYHLAVDSATAKNHHLVTKLEIII